jgi:hypothetical protein
MKGSIAATPGSGTRCAHAVVLYAVVSQESFMIQTCSAGLGWDEQDYGYWYHDSERIRPDLVSCMVAIDRAHSGNGCLNVLRGSHLLGRVDHSRQERGEMHADPDVRAESACLH